MNPNTNPTNPNGASISNGLQNTIPTSMKSSVAAGLLGIFLGAFGAQNWYLGENKKGVLHIALTCGGFILVMISAVMLALTAQVPFMSFFFGFLIFLSYIAIMGSSIWGFVEGIIILVQGDAGLAAKGYTVAAPAAYAQPVQPAQPTQSSQPTAAQPAQSTSSTTAETTSSTPTAAPSTSTEVPTESSAQTPAEEVKEVTEEAPAHHAKSHKSDKEA